MGVEEQRARFKNNIRIKPDRTPLPAAERVRMCAHAGCPDEGSFRVPKSRERLSEYTWFCLVHARAHNESWDYFKGMSEKEIESFRDDAVIGHRPTWPLG